MVFSLECLTLEIMTMIDIQRLLHQQHIHMVKTDKVQHISERYEIANFAEDTPEFRPAILYVFETC